MVTVNETVDSKVERELLKALEVLREIANDLSWHDTPKECLVESYSRYVERKEVALSAVLVKYETYRYLRNEYYVNLEECVI